jgi:hypothetical protein
MRVSLVKVVGMRIVSEMRIIKNRDMSNIKFNMRFHRFRFRRLLRFRPQPHRLFPWLCLD